MKQCETQNYSNILKIGKNLKNVVLAGGFCTNLVGFETNKKVQGFLNLMFYYNMIPLTNKSTWVT